MKTENVVALLLRVDERGRIASFVTTSAPLLMRQKCVFASLPAAALAAASGCSRGMWYATSPWLSHYKWRACSALFMKLGTRQETLPAAKDISWPRRDLSTFELALLARVLSSEVGAPRSLHALRMRHNDLGRSHSLLISALPLDTLRILDLGACRLRTCGAVSLARALTIAALHRVSSSATAVPPLPLQELYLASNAIGDEGIAALLTGVFPEARASPVIIVPPPNPPPNPESIIMQPVRGRMTVVGPAETSRDLAWTMDPARKCACGYMTSVAQHWTLHCSACWAHADDAEEAQDDAEGEDMDSGTADINGIGDADEMATTRWTHEYGLAGPPVFAARAQLKRPSHDPLTPEPTEAFYQHPKADSTVPPQPSSINAAPASRLDGSTPGTDTSSVVDERRAAFRLNLLDLNSNSLTDESLLVIGAYAANKDTPLGDLRLLSLASNRLGGAGGVEAFAFALSQNLLSSLEALFLDQNILTPADGQTLAATLPTTGCTNLATLDLRWQRTTLYGEGGSGGLGFGAEQSLRQVARAAGSRRFTFKLSL